MPTFNNQLTSELKKITDEYVAAFGGLSAEQLNSKPNPAVWSIAQVMEHVIQVNETYFPILDSLRKGTYKTPWTGKVGMLVNFFGKFIWESVEPLRKKKIKTFPIWDPSSSAVPGDIVQRFAAHQDKLITLIENSRDLVEKGTIISSPANKYIVYQLGVAFEIITTHEQRHLNQALEIKASLASK